MALGLAVSGWAVALEFVQTMEFRILHLLIFWKYIWDGIYDFPRILDDVFSEERSVLPWISSAYFSATIKVIFCRCIHSNKAPKSQSHLSCSQPVSKILASKFSPATSLLEAKAMHKQRSFKWNWEITILQFMFLMKSLLVHTSPWLQKVEVGKCNWRNRKDNQTNQWIDSISRPSLSCYN